MNRYFLLVSSIILIAIGCKKDDEMILPSGEPVSVSEILSSAIEWELNPYGNAPLAAEAVIKTKDLTRIEIQIGIEEPIYHQFSEKRIKHTLPVLGLKADYSNTVIFKLTLENEDFASDTIQIQTAPLPTFFPAIEILAHKENQSEPGFTLCEFLYAKDGKMIARPFLFDKKGNVRWYLNIGTLNNFFNPVKRLRNGNWIFALNETLYEYDMLGREINTWTFENYYQHHEVVEKEDGNFLLAATKKELDTVEDHIIELDRQSGAIINVWDLRQILDIDRFDLVWNSRDWLHVNSLHYVESDGSIVVSARHQGIFKVSADNNLVWILAPKKGWGTAGLDTIGKPTSNFLLTAINEEDQAYVAAVQQGEERAADFDWPWAQHAAVVTPEGNIACFDNGFNRFFRTNSSAFYSRGVEYAINEETYTVQQVWEYKATELGSFYSRTLGDADFLPSTKNRLICSGNIHFNERRYATILEIGLPQADIVYEARIHFANLYGSGSDSWGQSDMIYRCERLPIYPEQQ